MCTLTARGGDKLGFSDSRVLPLCEEWMAETRSCDLGLCGGDVCLETLTYFTVTPGAVRERCHSPAGRTWRCVWTVKLCIHGSYLRKHEQSLITPETHFFFLTEKEGGGGIVIILPWNADIQNKFEWKLSTFAWHLVVTWLSSAALIPCWSRSD